MMSKEAADAVVSSSPPRVHVPHVHRVLLYTTCYNVIDGVTLTIRKIEQEILASGHKVLILTTRSGDMANTHLHGTHPNREVIFLDNSIPIPFLEDPNNPSLQYHIGFALSRAVKARLDHFEPTIVHITVPDCTCLHLINYARSRQIPLMGTYHSNIPEYMQHYPGLSWLKHILGAFFRHQYNFLQALYVPTPFIRNHLIESHKMDKVTHLEIWGRGIDLQQFSPVHRSLKFRRSLGIADSDVVICWVGRLVPEKRTDVFCNVIRRLHEQNVPYHALVVGAGSSETEIKMLPNTTFCGWLNGDQLSIAYASSDVFLFPSSVETFGNVTLEAAASGLPLVVEAGCSGHLVNNGQNGFACTDEDSFFDATLQLVTDEQLRRKCAQASREHSLHFEKRKVVRRMLDHYTAVTDEFYNDYDGLHENRDQVYRQVQDSFLAGDRPRPLVLCLVEFLFVTIFCIVAWLASGFFWFQRYFTRRMEQMAPPPTPKRHVQMVELHVLDEEANDGEEDVINIVSMSESSTSSSSCKASCVSMLDAQCTQRLAIGFVNLILAQCRAENRVRRCLTCPSRAIRAKNEDDSKQTPLLATRSGFSEDSFLFSKKDDEPRQRRSPMTDVSLLEVV